MRRKTHKTDASTVLSACAVTVCSASAAISKVAMSTSTQSILIVCPAIVEFVNTSLSQMDQK